MKGTPTFLPSCKEREGQLNTELTADGSQPASSNREIDFSCPYEAAHCSALLPLYISKYIFHQEFKPYFQQYTQIHSLIILQHIDDDCSRMPMRGESNRAKIIRNGKEEKG